MKTELNLSVLPAEQQEIWRAFTDADLSDFMLYGGTALALQYGHRLSLDFDFFGSAQVTPALMQKRIPWLADNTVAVLQNSPNTYTVQAHSPTSPLGKPVKLSFFGGLDFPTMGEPIQADNSLEIASVRDLLATKLKAVYGRIEAKDYIDIAEILKRSDTPSKLLEKGLSDYQVLVNAPDAASPLRALCWFENGDLSSVNRSTRDLLESTAAQVGDIPKPEPFFRPRIGIARRSR